MLEYKAEWYGTNILKIGRFEPSSKTCSNCGYINKELTLKDRTWTCVKCNTTHDRDINAAINIKNFSLRNKASQIMGSLFLCIVHLRVIFVGHSPGFECGTCLKRPQRQPQ